MNLARIRKAIARQGIEQLTPLQQQMCTVPVPAKDILLSPTGSGKTLAFSIVLLRSLGEADGTVRGLVVVPTRELALQVYESVRALAAGVLKVAICYGGHSFETERGAMQGRPDIIVGTPGRILDHIRRHTVDIAGVTALVLDEYDKSLELGFLDEMEAIVRHIRKPSNLILTSATRLLTLPDFLPKDMVVIDYLAADDTPVPDIEFRTVVSPTADKLDTLEALLRDLGPTKSIVFVNHRDAAERVYDNLHKAGFPVGLYHGGLDQDVRERALRLFANGTTPILVSTDLASRGLDIGDVGAVIHYHLPVSEEAMIHRNGRTGRMGASGRAFAIVSEHDKIPDFFPSLDRYWPVGEAAPAISDVTTLYFNVGKRQKISRGDIVGFLIGKGSLTATEIGKIELGDNHAYVAVPKVKAEDLVHVLNQHKIKNTRARISIVKV